LPEPYHGLVYRVSGEPSECNERGMHSGMGCLQPRLSFPLHQQMVEDAASVPSGQQRVGVSEVWTLIVLRFGFHESGQQGLDMEHCSDSHACTKFLCREF
jgi:hypothetical protein